MYARTMTPKTVLSSRLLGCNPRIAGKFMHAAANVRPDPHALLRTRNVKDHWVGPKVDQPFHGFVQAAKFTTDESVGLEWPGTPAPSPEVSPSTILAMRHQSTQTSRTLWMYGSRPMSTAPADAALASDRGDLIYLGGTQDQPRIYQRHVFHGPYGQPQIGPHIRETTVFDWTFTVNGDQVFLTDIGAYHMGNLQSTAHFLGLSPTGRSNVLPEDARGNFVEAMKFHMRQADAFYGGVSSTTDVEQDGFIGYAFAHGGLMHLPQLASLGDNHLFTSFHFEKLHPEMQASPEMTKLAAVANKWLRYMPEGI